MISFVDPEVVADVLYELDEDEITLAQLANRMVVMGIRSPKGGSSLSSIRRYIVAAIQQAEGKLGSYDHTYHFAVKNKGRELALIKTEGRVQLFKPLVQRLSIGRVVWFGTPAKAVQTTVRYVVREEDLAYYVLDGFDQVFKEEELHDSYFNLCTFAPNPLED